MAGPAIPEPKPELGMKATIAALVFALTILVGFGIATAATFEDSFENKDDTEQVEDESHDDG